MVSTVIQHLDIMSLIKIYQKKYYWFKKFPPSAKLCQNIVSFICAETSPDLFEESGCAVCGKLIPICKMEELSEVENINLLKVNGVIRQAGCNGSDPVSELRGPILAPDCDRVCPPCVEFLENTICPLWLLLIVFGLEKFQRN